VALAQGLAIVAAATHERCCGAWGSDLGVGVPFATKKVETRVMFNGVAPVVRAALLCVSHAGKVCARSLHNVESVHGIVIVAIVMHQGVVVGIRLENRDPIGA
jgi:hypothetical protein